MIKRWGELDEETRDEVRWLLFMAGLAWWRPVHADDVRLVYDPLTNVLTMTDAEGAARFQLDEPAPQYRWN